MKNINFAPYNQKTLEANKIWIQINFDQAMRNQNLESLMPLLGF